MMSFEFKPLVLLTIIPTPWSQITRRTGTLKETIHALPCSMSHAYRLSAPTPRCSSRSCGFRKTSGCISYTRDFRLGYKNDALTMSTASRPAMGWDLVRPQNRRRLIPPPDSRTSATVHQHFDRIPKFAIVPIISTLDQQHLHHCLRTTLQCYDTCMYGIWCDKLLHRYSTCVKSFDFAGSSSLRPACSGQDRRRPDWQVVSDSPPPKFNAQKATPDFGVVQEICGEPLSSGHLYDFL